MDDELTEEEKRKRRIGGDIDMMLDELAAHRAKTRPHWREVEGAWEMSVNGQVVAALLPNSDPNFPDVAFLSQIVTNDLASHGWDAVDFATLEDAQHDIEQWWHHARRGEAYQPDAGPEQASVANENNPERVAALDAVDGRDGASVSSPDRAGGAQPQAEVMTREAIERDPWNAVALDVPGDATKKLLYQAATAARDCRFVLDDRAEEAESPEQATVWATLAERAAERQKEVEGQILQPGEALTKEAMRYDPWASVYLNIPPAAEIVLLRDAFDTAKYCAAAVEGGRGPSSHAFEPHLLGTEESQATNFARASERLVDLVLEVSRDLNGDRLTPAEQRVAEGATTYCVQEFVAERAPLSLDDIVERVQRLVDNPELLSDEIDHRVFDALDARRAAEVVEPERSAEEEQRLYQSTADAEPERGEPSAVPAIDAAMPQEMTDDAQIQYDRWTGERLSPETGQSRDAGHTLGGGMGRSR